MEVDHSVLKKKMKRNEIFSFWWAQDLKTCRLLQPTDAFNFESGVYCVVVMRKVKEKKVDMVIKSVQGGGFE